MNRPAMNARVTPYRPGDADRLELCKEQARDFCGASLTEAVAALAATGSAFTLRCPDGRVLLIAGVATVDAGYGHCWAFQSAHSGPFMLWLTRRVRIYLNLRAATHRRLEMMTRADFPAAARWADALGFAHEGVMACAATDGCDMQRYSRINRAAIGYCESIAA